MKKVVSFISSILIITMVSMSTSYAENLGYDGGEHTIIGDSVELSFPNGKEQASKLPLNLPSFYGYNGLSLTYVEFVAMPDFFGIVDVPISDGKTESERKQRFINAFNTLAQEKRALIEVPKLLSIIEQEKNLINDALNRGEEPSKAYKEINSTLNKEYNIATGGGSVISAYIPKGRMLQLSETNWDHFAYGGYAFKAYAAGHAVAIDTAISAHNETNNTKQRMLLELAYAQDGFANHFLTDTFAAGHLRAPRKELALKIFSTTVGGLLAGTMHNEENLYGLEVTNNIKKDGKSQTWLAYGDARAYDKENKQNLEIMIEAVQASVDEVYEAFQTGVLPKEYRVIDYLPRPVETSNYTPMFEYKNGVLYHRKHLFKPMQNDKLVKLNHPLMTLLILQANPDTRFWLDNGALTLKDLLQQDQLTIAP